MRVTVLELAAVWDSRDAVLAEVANRLAAGPPTDLVLLPEQALTGYVSPARDFDLTRFAEPIDGPTARAIADLAVAAHTHLVAPLVLREGSAIYNAMVCFDARGALVFAYRKRHPWLPETWATPGPSPAPVVTIAGKRVTIAICYDLHFLADDLAPDVDVLLFASAWVERPDSRPQRLASLARAAGITIANANWAPGVVRVPGQGGSCIVAPDGSVTAIRGDRLDAEL
ncbi:MAG TPA: carbon-nitrogen hydrolase family protein [Kofleriaceae bacterium]|nr:carbon-nitrogen hydrolase family protein [Kofleriaceae bacterium]